LVPRSSILAAVLAISAAATAQPRTAEQRAAELASEGVHLFQDGRYKEALTRFLESYAHAHIPEVIWNIGRCYEELGDLPSALRYFEEFLPLAPNDEARKKALARIEKVRREIERSGTTAAAESALIVSVEDAEVREVRVVVDGQEVYAGPAPARVALAPGSHVLAVSGGEAVQPVQKTVRIEAGGLEVVVLRPPAAPAAEPAMAAHATDPDYCDPFLFPTSRMGFAVGGEFSPVFVRGNPFRGVAGAAPALPTQSFAGFFAQAGSDRFAATLRVGRASRVPSWLLYPSGDYRLSGAASWNLHQPFQRAGLEWKARTHRAAFAWNTILADLDYRRFVFSVAGQSEALNSLELSFSDAFGFTIARRVSFEFLLGIAVLVPKADDSDGWNHGTAIAFPMAGRVSVRVVEAGHVAVEARWPLTIGPLNPPENTVWSRAAGVQADLAVGYRQILGNVQVGGALVFALNRTGEFGREKVWLLLSGQYQF